MMQPASKPIRSGRATHVIVMAGLSCRSCVPVSPGMTTAAGSVELARWARRVNYWLCTRELLTRSVRPADNMCDSVPLHKREMLEYANK